MNILREWALERHIESIETMLDLERRENAALKREIDLLNGELLKAQAHKIAPTVRQAVLKGINA